VNGDGIPDFAAAAVGRDQIRVYSGSDLQILYATDGEAEGDLFGSSLSGKADIDNDGIRDLIVGAYENDLDGENAGRAYVYLLGDNDGDIFLNGCDNCPIVPNPMQSDLDGDGHGDLCDNCIDTYNPGQEDLDSNGIGDACQCACSCHAAPDASCTSDVDVLDVVQAVNVAFRNAPDIIDPDPNCPRTSTDVDCDDDTDVLDVVRFVNVAFRNADPATEFCDPCAP
jgi:hypothetical protein